MQKRILKVSGISSYNYKPVPYIRIQGQWLHNLGFSIGDRILIEEGFRQIKITVLDSEKEEKGR